VEENRALSSSELELVRWLLQNAGPAAQAHLPELEGLRVVSRCGCGCASIDFTRARGAGLEVLSDYEWEDGEGRLFGVFVFAKNGSLAGLDVWSIDGRATPTALPNVESLRPCGS